MKSVLLDDVHLEILNKLTSFYRSASAEFTRNIALIRLHNNFGGSTIKNPEKLSAINIKK